MNFSRYILTICAVFFCGTLTTGVMVMQSAHAAQQEIAAVVNDGAISVHDLNKRMKLIMASSGLQNTKEIRQRLTPQILASLVSEQVMMQEARKNDIVVDGAEIEAGFAKIAQQNNNSPEKFKSALSRSGIDLSTMYAQIEAQIAWSKVVQRNIRPKVIVSDRDVDATMERLQSKIGTKEYLAAEIFLPVDDPKQSAQAKQLANRLVGQIRSGKASFFKLAQQFSQSAGSSNGGDLGWIQDTQMSEEFLVALRKVKKDQVTSAIETPSGFHILFLRDVRTITEDTLPSRDQVYYTIGSERLEKAQRQHLMDLRAAAFVDIRV